MTKAKTTHNTASKAGSPASSSEAMMKGSQAFQLTRLSSVLNGLEGGASVIRRHLQDAMHAVHTGTYTIDSTKLSRRIIGEALGSI